MKIHSAVLFCSEVEFVRHIALPKIPEGKIVFPQVVRKQDKLGSAIVSIGFFSAAETCQTGIGFTNDIAYFSCDCFAVFLDIGCRYFGVSQQC